MTLTVGTLPVVGGQGLLFDMPSPAQWSTALYDGGVFDDVDVEITSSAGQVGYLLSNAVGTPRGEWCGDACYEVAVNPGFSPAHLAIRRIDGVNEVVDELALGFGPLSFSNSFRIRLRKAGGTIELYIDGVLYLSAVDPAPLPPGKVGTHLTLSSPGVGEYGKFVINPGYCLSFTPTSTLSPSPTQSPTPDPLRVPPPSAFTCSGCEAYCDGWAGPTNTLGQWVTNGSAALALTPHPTYGPVLRMEMTPLTWGSVLLSGPAYADPEIEVTNPHSMAAAILFNVSGGLSGGYSCDDCYLVYVNPTVPPSVALDKANAGAFTRLSVTAGPAGFSDGFFTTTIRKNGSLLQVYVNGILSLSYNDSSPHGAGQVGLLALSNPSPYHYYGKVVVQPYQSCPSLTPTPTHTATVTPTRTMTGTWTPTASPTSTPSASPTPSPSPTGTATLTLTATMTVTHTLTVSPVYSPTLIPTVTQTPTLLPPSGEGGEPRVYPNPAPKGTVHVVFDLRGQAFASFKVWNAAAQLCTTLQESFGGGPQKFTLDVSDYAAGTYLYQLRLDYKDGGRVAYPIKRLVVLP